MEILPFERLSYDALCETPSDSVSFLFLITSLIRDEVNKIAVPSSTNRVGTLDSCMIEARAVKVRKEKDTWIPINMSPYLKDLFDALRVDLEALL